MNIQIFGKNKCFDTKKAERYFKERRIPFQSIDLKRYGMSGREFDSVLRAVGGIDNLIDWDSKSPEVTLMKYMEEIPSLRTELSDEFLAAHGLTEMMAVAQSVPPLHTPYVPRNSIVREFVGGSCYEY